MNWWSTVLSFFAAPASLLGGNFPPLPVVATLGLACLLIGIGLAVTWRVTQAWWLLIAAAIAALTPLVIGFANSVLGWMGMLFAVLGGAVYFLVQTAVIANGADRRLPVWLIGIAIAMFAAFCAAVSGAFISLSV